MSGEKPALACVIGHPAAHSRSPLLHNYWLNRYGIEGRYVARDVAPAALGATLANLAREGLHGANITVPHKQAAFRLVQDHDEAARACRAVNTIVARKDGSLFGMNTDGFGFIENLKTEFPQFRGARAVIFGAGGAARAIVRALPALGISEIRIVNRTRANAESLAADLVSSAAKIEVHSWDKGEDALSGAALAINATSLGMKGRPPLALDFSNLNKEALVADTVYAPLETAWLKNAKAGGFATLDGLGMLVHQARPCFRAWFGVDPEITRELKAMLIRDLQKDM